MTKILEYNIKLHEKCDKIDFYIKVFIIIMVIFPVAYIAFMATSILKGICFLFLLFIFVSRIHYIEHKKRSYIIRRNDWKELSFLY